MAAAVRCGLLAVSVALAGCGGSHRPAPAPPKRAAPPVTNRTTAPVTNRAVGNSHAPQLIEMRRIDGATWQTVIVRTDGTGDVGTFVGEWAGTKHKGFRLGGRELGQLERLAAVAERTPEKPYFGTPAPSTVWIIYVQRHILQVGTGHEPRQLAPLTGILGGLIDQYS